MIVPAIEPKHLNKDFMDGYQEGYKTAMFEIWQYASVKYGKGGVSTETTTVPSSVDFGQWIRGE